MSNANATDDGTKPHVQHLGEIGAVEKTHVDGTVDLIDTRALGGDLAEMPPGYYYSLHFIGTFTQFIMKGRGIMPPRIFKNIGFVAVVMCASIGAMVYYSMTVLWPTVIGTVYTSNVMQVGWQSSVVGGGFLLGQAMGGFGLSYIPKVKWQTVLTSVIGAAFCASLASIELISLSTFIGLGIIATVSIGYVENITFPGVTLLFEPEDIGLATGVLGSIRAMAGAVSQALYSSVLSTRLAENLPEFVGPAVIGAGLPESSVPSLLAGIAIGNVSSVPGVTDEIMAVATDEVRRAYVQSFKVVFLTTIPFGVLLVSFAFFVPNMEGYLGKTVARKLQFRSERPGLEKDDVKASTV
ncbi:hypothetical protein B0A52_10385 [Exophiala mesophila]|uniref:Major facilitator superfamily (MFS) profile domain-containing protein n=1 Tax=Exophiala mesophila TaxID=212818 RepID=A0A438MR58_EXOME|nr:hypothetical protein B0A52_10385 [Exophiala mesophila]